MRVESLLIASVFLLAGGCASDPAGFSGANTTDADGGAAVASDGGASSPSPGDSGSPPTGPSSPAGPDAGPVGGNDAGGGGYDAGPPPNLDGGTTFVVAQPVSGTPTPTTAPLHGPGLILMGGGTDVNSAFVWMHDTLAGSSSTKMGNVLVFNVQTPIDNAYTAYIFGLAPFQSVMTLYLGGYKNNGRNMPAATVADIELAAYYVSRSDAVFFAGGDQADYVSWYKTSPSLTNALTALYNRGGVIGGTSAGCAIQGPYVFDSLAGDDMGADPATVDIVKNPYESSISFTHNMFTFPSLPNVLADPHFVTRDRMGRLAGFVARQYADGVAPSGVLGVGIDESNALLVDKNGLAKLAQQSGGTEAAAGTGAYVFQPAGPATTCTAGSPLVYNGVKVTRLSSPATDSFDFGKGCGTGVQFALSVNGGDSSPYSPNPYTTAGTATKCP